MTELEVAVSELSEAAMAFGLDRTAFKRSVFNLALRRFRLLVSDSDMQ